MKESEYAYYGYTVTEFQKYCGLVPNKPGQELMLDDEELLQRLYELCVEEERIPHQSLLRTWVRDGRFPIHTLEKRFGGMLGVQERLLKFAHVNGHVSNLAELPGWKIDTESLVESWKSEPTEALNEECFVYLMKDIRNGRHKIGIARNPEIRERTLQSEQPKTQLVVYKKYVNRKIAAAFEKALHETYSHKRSRGEWFALDAEDLKELRATLDDHDA
jgi:predicted GIY-YIG superfamily endonuclease